jgi:hypothetical protein
VGPARGRVRHQGIAGVVLQRRQVDAVVEGVLQAERVAQFVQQGFVAVTARGQVVVLREPLHIVEIDISIRAIVDQRRLGKRVAAVPAAQARDVGTLQVRIAQMNLGIATVGDFHELDTGQLRDIVECGTRRQLLGDRKRLLAGLPRFVTRQDRERVIERVAGRRQEIPVWTGIE